MDYKKKYKEAFERARQIHSKTEFDYEKGMMEEVFPELCESEDEKIRKFLIKWIQDNYYHGTTEIPTKTLIAWLEKQGEKPKPSIRERYKRIANSEWFKKTHEGMSISDDEKVDNVNKIEPKFKVGDWITNGACVIQITSVDDRYYWHENDCVGGDIESIDKKYHLWTIDDAKPGDILIDSWKELRYPVIFILKDFKSVDHGLCKPSDYHSFCYLKANDAHTFCAEGWHHKNNIQPANKEQRDLLFTKMKEAGYEWDADKKELKKIEDEPLVIDEGKAETDYCFTKMMNGEKVSPTWSEKDEKIFNKIIQKLDKSDNVSHYDYAGFEMWLIDLKERLIDI